MYRTTPTGIANKAGVGASADEIVKYIQQIREALNGHPDLQKKIGHVDTWTVWVDPANAAVVNAVDWIGMDGMCSGVLLLCTTFPSLFLSFTLSLSLPSTQLPLTRQSPGYPYYQTVNDNTIENAESLFFDSYNATVAAAQGKPVWVTETGWPKAGPKSGKAEASIPNAKKYWDDVGCRLFGNINTWWFALDDTKQDPNEISFSVIAPNLGDPLWDLMCPAA
jgi:glucan endo-1,3-beta-D-glucosidase